MRRPASSAEVTGELKSLRARVLGLGESVISTADGLLVTADAAAVHPESLSALAAAALGLGRRTAAEAGLGGLREVMTRCNGGYVVIFAVGDGALLAVVGDEGLDLPALHREAPATVKRLEELLV